MQIISSTLKARAHADVIVIPVWKDHKKVELAVGSKEFASLVKGPLQNGDFFGKEGETLLLYPAKGKEKRILLLGLGGKKGSLPDALRRAYASSIKAIRSKHWKKVNFLIPETDLMARDVICKAVVEGVLLSSYSFDSLKGESAKEENHSHLEKICFCGLEKEEEVLLKRLKTIIDSVNFARDLVNGNADDVNVETLIAHAKELAKSESSVKTTIMDKKALQKEKMGLILAVGQGATLDPAIIIMEYKGDPKSKEKIALVGKGITFDTGGLNLKPTGGIETMKCDMAGAAAVLATMQAAAALKLKKNLIGVLAVAENAIGPGSYKPGDVLRSYSGKTVEINNTDAEGRLVLADAISYVEERYAPTQIIDLATLTGGVVIALGEEATGLFCNDEKLARELERAGERTHERLWRLPLYPEYKEMLKSSIADLKNSGPRKATAATGAIFLQQFVKKIAWAHLDIAGTAYLSELKPYHPTHATGVGVRLLIDYFEHLNVPS
ncbi:MAG: leucyl aminopeptidase [Chlamydiota bacterium]